MLKHEVLENFSFNTLNNTKQIINCWVFTLKFLVFQYCLSTAMYNDSRPGINFLETKHESIHFFLQHFKAIRSRLTLSKVLKG
jgi:hypothetical protein